MAANLVEIQTPMPDDSAKSRAEAALMRVEHLTITTADDYRMAAADLQAIKGQFKTVDGQREELKAPSLEGCRRVDAFFKAPLDFLRSAETILKKKLQKWDDDQKEIARKEQARLDEIARQERVKREAEAAETARKSREKADADRRAAEEERRKADAAKAAGDAVTAAAAQKAAQKLETRAFATEQRGAERAEALQAQAASVVAPIVQVDIPKVSGLTNRDNWKAEGFDLMATVRAVAAGEASVALLTYNEKVLGQQARSLREHFMAPGVRVWNDKTKAAGAA